LVFFCFYVSFNCQFSLIRPMTEPPVDPGQPLSLPVSGRTTNPPYQWKKATLVGLLSLLFAGMGQLYNRQPRKAFGVALISFVLGMLPVKTRLLLTFSTMVLTMFILVAWKLLVAAEAAYTAATAKKPEPAVPLPSFTYSFLAIAFFVAAVIPNPDQVKSEAGFAAFKVPSASMCPTICIGDRIVADMHAYKSKLPQRGDLIMMKHASSTGLFIKRVIGVPGDTVTPGSNGTVLVNGQRFNPPASCSPAILQKIDSAEDFPFESTTVPEGSLFVVGDNLANSFDSRIAAFGAVTPDMVRGKPLYLYWSHANSRIGCTLR
jgi:signal peptidase I